MAEGSALLRRYIGRQFTELRKRAGLSQEKAADALQRARATLARIEDGDHRVRFRNSDVEAMLSLYGATDEERERLLGLTADTRNGYRKSWLHDYTETVLPKFFAPYVDNLTGAMYLNKPGEIEAYRMVWDDLTSRALDEASSREVIGEWLKEVSI